MASSNDEKLNEFKKLLHSGEYEAQLFETASYCLFLEIKELTLNDIRKATGKLQEKLVSKCGNPEEISKAEHLIQQLRAKYEISVDTCFKDLETAVKNIFCIPAHILLPEDSIQSEQYTDEDIGKIDDEIQGLMSRYRRAVCLESLLKKEKKFASCVDIIKKKTLEVENNIAVLEKIFQRNSQGLTQLSIELNDLLSFVNQIRPFPPIENVEKNKFLKEKYTQSVE